MSLDKKILVCGIGALGGVFSFKLLKEGYDCQLVTNNDRITNAIINNGIFLDDERLDSSIQPKIQTELPNNQSFDFIFLMMKTISVRDTVKEIKEKNLLKKDGLLITIQNGDVYTKISDLFPDQLTTCIIVWGASMVDPGVYKITSSGKTFIGDRKNRLNLEELRVLLSKVSPAPVEISNNILGIIWSKLCVNCAINAISGISGLRIGEFTKYSKGRILFLAVYSEVVEIAKKQNIKLEKLVTNPFLFYIPKNANFVKRFIKIFIIKRAGKRFGMVKPSMLQDLERGRRTEIDFLNGYVSTKGIELDLPTPVNSKLTELIKSIEKGDLKPSVDNFSLIEIS